jgi:DNA-binding beta-propeller fold protein YncE
MTNIASASGFDVDGAGNVYVAVTSSNQVWKFIPTNSSFMADTNFGFGGFIGITNGISGTNGGEFNAPFDVAVSPDGGTISVSDSGNNRIQQFSASNGVFIATFGTNGNAIGQFNNPEGLTYDSAGTLYIVDSGNNRIALAQDFGVVGVTGTNGTALGQFSSPTNISVDERGVYVADAGNNRIQSFAPPVADGLFSIDPSVIRFAVSTGLSAPAAVAAVDSLTNEMFYVADTGNNRVLLYKLAAEDPTPAWTNLMANVATGHIEDALSSFSVASVDQYRQAFLSVGTANALSAMNEIGTLTLVYINNDRAEYYFTDTIAGQTITFPVEFDKENGVWKILEF